jgi:DNA-binding HxlR family transcriptional regulator
MVSTNAQVAADIPVAEMVENIVGCKWSVQVLRVVAEHGQRSVHGEQPPLEVAYTLTPFGERFMGILNEVRRLQEDVDRAVIDS